MGEKAGFKGINMTEAFILRSILPSILRRMVLIGKLSDIHVICLYRAIYTLNYSMVDCGSF